MDEGSKKENKAIAAQIVSAHQKSENQCHARLNYLPDKNEVTEITELLRRLAFPGYFGETGQGEFARDIEKLTAEIRQRLTLQICRAFNIEGDAPECSDMFCRSSEICGEFMRRIPSVIELLFTDVQAAYDGDPAAKSVHEVIFAYPGVFAVSVFRFAHELHSLSVPLIPRMMTEYAHSLTGIDIHPGAEIGHHFFIDHGTGIVIGETTEIGAYAKLYQGVTLGALSTRGGQSLNGKKRHPTLGDEVTVYSGATILGGETTIGNGCVIGGNVFITKPVPPNTRVNLKN